MRLPLTTEQPAPSNLSIIQHSGILVRLAIGPYSFLPGVFFSGNNPTRVVKPSPAIAGTSMERAERVWLRQTNQEFWTSGKKKKRRLSGAGVVPEQELGSLNGGTGRFARHKLVYWSLNRVNEERSQLEGREETRKERRQEKTRRRQDRRGKKRRGNKKGRKMGRRYEKRLKEKRNRGEEG
ncbi:hypothetical protein GBF38_005165 [Nibea albiflora]|uniref:Uncharacterized protein n=1 Tax=Nibea albiflora TaxID=240163 RepID=A0ACB7EVH2_NIBAL|nr:hypothetical protein GBF38_005165 [Nibea albiflora]